MVLKNKEGNCFKTASKASKIEALKAIGYTEVTEETNGSVTPAAPKKGKGKGKGEDKAPEVTEETNGSVTVTV
jgi:hypothetical protein